MKLVSISFLLTHRKGT